MAVAETGGKFRRQWIILSVMAKPKKKITVEKTGKTIRGCRDKHQGNLFERDGARKVSMKSKLRVTARANVFRLSFPVLRTLSGMELAGVLEGVREAGTDLYR